MAPPPSSPPPHANDVAVAIDSPSATSAYAGLVDAPGAGYETMHVSRLLYTSAFLALLQPAQFGWSLSQVNLSAYNDKNACDARPVVEGTCLMFPGHTKNQWTWVVNAWVLGGMVGALASSKLSDRFGRKTTLQANCLVMAAAAAVQASASSVAVFAVGRALAGVASGVATSMANGYISEIAPPHLRNKLGVGYQISIAISCLLLAILFFAADTASGWRYIAAFPALIALVFFVLAPRFMVESPAWLLTKGRQQEAEDEIAKMFGRENIALALSWMQQVHNDKRADHELLSTSAVATKMHTQHDAESQQPATAAPNPWKTMISRAYRQQTILAASMALALQFSGINAVYFYSSTMFKDAGLADDRVGILIVNIVNVVPSVCSGYFAARYGNRTMLLFGQLFMLLCAVGLTVVLLVDVKALSVVFVSLYVAGFGVSLGPLAFVVATEVFPDELRASGGSLTLFANWCGTLVIGVGYPYVADALDELGFLPFIATITLFTTYMFKYLPETSGKTTDEIQDLFRTKQ